MLVVKNLPVIAEDVRDAVRSLGQEDPLKKGMATHFSILAWKIPWTEEPGGLQFIGSQRVRLKRLGKQAIQLNRSSLKGCALCRDYILLLVLNVLGKSCDILFCYPMWLMGS